MKKFLKRNKRAFIYLGLILAFIVALSFISLLVLKAMGVIYIHEEEILFNVEIFDNFKSSWYGWIIFIVLRE